MPSDLGFTLSQRSQLESTEEKKQVFQPGKENEESPGPCSQCTEDGAVDQHTVHTGRPGPQQGAVRQTVVPATHEAEAGRVLKPRRLGSAWGTQKHLETPFHEETNKKKQQLGSRTHRVSIRVSLLMTW